MKKNCLLMLFMALIAAMSVMSCSDDKEESGGNAEGGATGGQVLGGNDQKAQLEATAKELMSKINAEDFRNITDLFNYVDDNSHDESVVEDWFDACKETCKLSGSTRSDKKYLYKASNFCGQFELQNHKWVKTGTAAYLQFKFWDSSNRECILKATWSESGTKVHHEVFDEEDWNYPYGEEYTENSFFVPNTINVTLTQAGAQLASATVNTNITAVNGEADLATSSATVSTTLNVNNYSIVVDRVQFNGGRNATGSVSATFTKAGETLVTMSLNGTGDTTNEENLKAGQVTVNTDILGQVQVRGTVSDIESLRNALDEADENSYDETAFKAAIDRANGLIDVNLYFNGSGSPSSYMKLYASKDNSYYYEEEWEYEPVIMFSDDSGYSTFDDYFADGSFDDVADMFERLVDDFTDLTE